jgi:hypothetical protein
LRGEGWGEGLLSANPEDMVRTVPPHPKFAIANFDLSPQAGRDKALRAHRIHLPE